MLVLPAVEVVLCPAFDYADLRPVPEICDSAAGKERDDKECCIGKRHRSSSDRRFKEGAVRGAKREPDTGRSSHWGKQHQCHRKSSTGQGIAECLIGKLTAPAGVTGEYSSGNAGSKRIYITRS